MREIRRDSKVIGEKFLKHLHTEVYTSIAKTSNRLAAELLDMSNDASAIYVFEDLMGYMQEAITDEIYSQMIAFRRSRGTATQEYQQMFTDSEIRALKKLVKEMVNP